MGDLARGYMGDDLLYRGSIGSTDFQRAAATRYINRRARAGELSSGQRGDMLEMLGLDRDYVCHRCGRVWSSQGGVSWSWSSEGDPQCVAASACQRRRTLARKKAREAA